MVNQIGIKQIVVIREPSKITSKDKIHKNINGEERVTE